MWLRVKVGLVILFTIAIWCLPLAIGFLFFDRWEERGQFGDLFGSISALFSGLAFVGLIYTIYLQMHELRLQRTELQLQRKEMAASRGELARQADVQAALANATVGQIRAAVEQLRVEAIKMEAEGIAPGARANYESKIRVAAERLNVVADKLANENARNVKGEA